MLVDVGTCPVIVRPYSIGTIVTGSERFGYGAFLEAVPAAWAGALPTEELTAAIRRRLRLTFQQLRSGTRWCGCCSTLMDVFGDHAEACLQHARGHDYAAHNFVRDAVLACAREAGLEPVSEARDLVDDTQERPADVYLPACSGHGLGGDGSAGLGACIDVSGVRALTASALRSNSLLKPLQRRFELKAKRAFPPSAAAQAAAAVAAAGAQREALEAESTADDEAISQARREVYSRTVASFAPRWFVAPFVFSSLGFLADGTEVVLQAMAARYAACEEAGGAEGAGHGVLHARWLPRLSAAIERGAWRRLRPLLRGASGVAEGDVLVASELVCASRFLHLSSTDARGAG